MGNLSKIIVAKGFKKSPKVQNIAKSGHTDYHLGTSFSWNAIGIKNLAYPWFDAQLSKDDFELYG